MRQEAGDQGRGRLPLKAIVQGGGHLFKGSAVHAKARCLPPDPEEEGEDDRKGE